MSLSLISTTEAKTYKDLTLTQTEIMLRILSHVPEKHFKMIRYFSFLSNRLWGSLLPLIYKQLRQEIVAAKIFSFAVMVKVFLKVDLLNAFGVVLEWFLQVYIRVESRSIGISDKKYHFTEANLSP